MMPALHDHPAGHPREGLRILLTHAHWDHVSGVADFPGVPVLVTEEERRSSKTLVYQVLPSRYGLNPDDLRRCDAIEVVVGQGAKPGGGGTKPWFWAAGAPPSADGS